MVFVRLYQRTSQSYEVALEQYHERVAANLQPSTGVIDLFNVETEEALLLSANLSYLVLVTLLFLQMLVSCIPGAPRWSMSWTSPTSLRHRLFSD